MVLHRFIRKLRYSSISAMMDFVVAVTTATRVDLVCRIGSFAEMVVVFGILLIRFRYRFLYSHC